MPRPPLNFEGRKINMLKVLRLLEYSDKQSQRYHLVRCDCGKEVKMPSVYLKNDKYSCGCTGRPRKKYKAKHGMSRHELYPTWNSMHCRCYNDNSINYRFYGGKGVYVCDEWHDIGNFVKWCYSKGWYRGLTIDRIDSSREYSPSNCQLLTHAENSGKH